MRIEVRKTGEDWDAGIACEHCGATPLITTKNGRPAVADITQLVEAEVDQRDRQRRVVFRHELDKVIGRERGVVEAKLRDANVAYDSFTENVVEGLRGLTDTDVSRWRLLRSRREREWAERVEAMVAALLEETRRV